MNCSSNSGWLPHRVCFHFLWRQSPYFSQNILQHERFKQHGISRDFLLPPKKKMWHGITWSCKLCTGSRVISGNRFKGPKKITCNVWIGFITLIWLMHPCLNGMQGWTVADSLKREFKIINLFLCWHGILFTMDGSHTYAIGF